LKTTNEEQIRALREQVERLRSENAWLKERIFTGRAQKTVIVPDEMAGVFDAAEQNVQSYFEDFSIQPGSGEIMAGGERYLLFKSASLSYEFLDIIRELYSNRTPEEATRIGNNFLFDIAYVLGKKDAYSFLTKSNLTDPLERMAAGPVHFAYTGWANVEILPESTPTRDKNYFVKYYHHNSFEAQSWKKAGRKSDAPVCTMSCGYSSGWCEESFGMPLTVVEIECEATGAEHCTFIMAPPDRISEYLRPTGETQREEDIDIPVFFRKRYVEDKLRSSLEQKERLLQEVHHRVKNNLQLISSLMSLQLDTLRDESLKKDFRSGMMRINTMARVHEMLYSDKDLSMVQTEYYFRHLFLSLVQDYDVNAASVQIEIVIDIQEGYLEADRAIPIGLILNEITENAYSHLLCHGGIFRLQLTEDHERYFLVVSCTGGFAPDPIENEPGLSLMHILCEQLEATLSLDTAGERSCYQITLKKTPEKKSAVL
jgi:two-component sensor histidine kinase/predicted hydrocarbon binding protein